MHDWLNVTVLGGAGLVLLGVAVRAFGGLRGNRPQGYR